MTIADRDLAAPELWERSLRRSRQRRALAPKLRRDDRRRKQLSAAVAAATMAGPGTPMALAQTSGDVQADVAAETPWQRAIEVREGGLPLMLGSQGALVAEVQKAVGVPADGIFGVQTDTAVRSYQTRAGLEVDGIVGPITWSALFERAAVDGSDVPQQVKQRIEQRLQAAGTSVDTGPGLSGNGLFGAGGQRQRPSIGEPQPGPAPVTGSCGSSTIAAPVKGPVTSEYGPRWGRHHDGIDIAAPIGTAVRAAACGTVTIAGQQSGYGNIVCITHTSQFSTCYAHLSRFGTSQGAQVTQGQAIGYVGCTGNCTGPHLHFETRVNGQAQNPRPYLGGGTIPGRAAATARASSVAAASTPRTTATTSNAAVTSSGGGAPVPVPPAPAATAPTPAPNPAASAPPTPAPVSNAPAPNASAVAPTAPTSGAAATGATPVPAPAASPAAQPSAPTTGAAATTPAPADPSSGTPAPPISDVASPAPATSGNAASGGASASEEATVSEQGGVATGQ